MTGVTAANEEWIGTVEWNDADYQALEQRFEWRERPSTLAVVLAQEDLWVIEALLRVIKKTNEGATSFSTASVKRIEALQIGNEAVAAWKDSEEPIFRSGGATGGGGGMGMPGGGGMGMPGGGGMGMPGGGGMGMPGGGGMGMPGGGGTEVGGMGTGTGGGGEELIRRQLIEGRYVDDKGQPLPYDAEFPPTKPYAEFKMMPIRMNLVMDQRRLPKLLAECANSNMPIQVRRVRIMKSQGGSLDFGAGAGPAASMGRGGAGPRSMGPMGAAGQSRMPGGGGMGIRSTGDKQEGGPHDIPVEIQGIIYIYNPPEIEKVGTGTASVEKPADAAGPAGAALPAKAPVAPANEPVAPAKAPVAPADAPAKTPVAPAARPPKP